MQLMDEIETNFVKINVHIKTGLTKNLIANI